MDRDRGVELCQIFGFDVGFEGSRTSIQSEADLVLLFLSQRELFCPSVAKDIRAGLDFVTAEQQGLHSMSATAPFSTRCRHTS